MILPDSRTIADWDQNQRCTAQQDQPQYQLLLPVLGSLLDSDRSVSVCCIEYTCEGIIETYPQYAIFNVKKEIQITHLSPSNTTHPAQSHTSRLLRGKNGGSCDSLDGNSTVRTIHMRHQHIPNTLWRWYRHREEQVRPTLCSRTMLVSLFSSSSWRPVTLLIPQPGTFTSQLPRPTLSLDRWHKCHVWLVLKCLGMAPVLLRSSIYSAGLGR